MRDRIEVKPDLSRRPPRTESGTGKTRRRRSIFGGMARGVGWLATAPAGWLDAPRIVRGATFIRSLFVLLRSPPPRDTRFKTEAGCFDLEATAFSYGLSVHALEARLVARRRQTARIAYASFALACAFLLGWLWQALSMPLSSARLASLVYFVPFCVLCFLIAFYNALLNFQIRTGRLATWRQYLVTTDSFWPS